MIRPYPPSAEEFGAILDEMDHEAKYQTAVARQQLVARIKRSSKYWGQTAPNEWFDVRIVGDASYRVRGNDNNYRLSDLTFGVRLSDGSVVDLTRG